MSPEQQVFRSLHQLPQPPADFTGREELIAQLMADFKQGQGATITAQPIHGLTGMGGIGKTALGLVVAHQITKDYPDAQIFLDLKGTTTPLSATEVMRHVILSFEPKMNLSKLDEAGMASAYHSVLHSKRVLLFLDNARSAEQVAPLRPSETCAMLVTSRWTFGVPGLKNRHVGVMSAENAERFLLELCPRISKHAAELADDCAYLPLALRIAGSFLQVNEDLGVEQYITKLNNRKHRLDTLEQSHEEAELKTEPDLLATFELSYHALPEEDQKRWRMLGVFPTSFDVSAACALWNIKEDPARKLLSLSLRYGVLDYDATSARYGLHDLLAEFALMKMNEGEEANARISHSVYYSEILGNINQMYLQGAENILLALRLYDVEWINIQAGEQTAALSLEETHGAAEACNRYAWQAAINELRLKPKDRINWLEAGLQAARVLKDRKAEAAHLGNLGLAYYRLGEARKAIEIHEGHLALAREIGDRHSEGQALGNLGLAYADLGEVHKAIQFYDLRLAIAREIGDRRAEAAVLGNLGVAYKNLGEVHKAIQFYEQDLAIAREIGDRRGEGAVLGNLGVAYKNLGEVHKAIQFYEKALVIAREIGDRQNEGNWLGNLGVAYKNLGEAHKAIQFHEQRLAIAREIGDRRGEVIALGNLGLAYADLGEAHKAIEFQEQTLAIAREIGDRRGEGQTLGNLGLAYQGLGESQKAIKFYEQALAVEREVGYRRGEGNALGNLGLVYADLGEVHKAIEFYEQALAVAQEIGDRYGEGSALNNLGLAYANLGEAQKAIELYEQALAVAHEIGDRRGEGNALLNMGLPLYALEQKDRAIDLVKQAVEIYEALESPYAEKARNQLKEWGAL
jgi:tetratricopeptide (TPR) repeat protein